MPALCCLGKDRWWVRAGGGGIAHGLAGGQPSSPSALPQPWQQHPQRHCQRAKRRTARQHTAGGLLRSCAPACTPPRRRVWKLWALASLQARGSASAPLCTTCLQSLHDGPTCAGRAGADAQGEIFAAEGYAKVTGKVGVCIATSGPGATNLVTGLADALLDSVPLVAITGQVGGEEELLLIGGAGAWWRSSSSRAACRRAVASCSCGAHLLERSWLAAAAVANRVRLAELALLLPAGSPQQLLVGAGSVPGWSGCS